MIEEWRYRLLAKVAFRQAVVVLFAGAWDIRFGFVVALGSLIGTGIGLLWPLRDGGRMSDGD
jgi:divalent metal cation (Fe/Co/Zn/Cd) transporter